MTVENQTNKKRFAGDGSTDEVTFNFRVVSASDIKVYVYPEDLDFADLEDYLLTGGGVDYDVELEDDGEGGTITFTTAPASDELGLLLNVLDLTQTADLPTEGNFNETSVELALDRLVMQNIQQQEQMNRGLSLRPEDPLAVDGFTGIFIEAVAAEDRAARVLQFNADGDGVEAGLLTTDLADLNEIADDISTVAGISGNVTTVAGISGNVTTVAGIASEVSTVAGIAAAVTTVSGISANVTTVAGISANVTTVAGISAAVTTVAGISTAVSNVSSISTAVSNVNTIRTDVTTVSGISGNVTTVAGISGNVTTVAGISANVTTVAGISGNVTTVAGISANVTTVAGISSDVTTVASNITDIQNAEENANIAKAAAGYTYTYSTTTTAADPGSGKVRFNNATLSSATAMYISETTGLSQAIASDLATWDDGTSTIRGRLRLFKQADPSVFVLFDITGTLTDNGTWDTFTVAYVGGSGSLANNDVLTIQFLTKGDKGDTGATGPAGSISDGDKGDITVSSSGTVWTADATLITGKSSATIAANDKIMFGDTSASDALKQTTVQGILDLVTGGQAATSVQVLTSGSSATYTTPANCTAILVKAVGGGGGGGSTGSAGTGGTTTFNSVNAVGGGAADVTGATQTGGIGGTGGTGTATYRFAGARGGAGGSNLSGVGGGSFMGPGAGSTEGGTGGRAAPANSGGGGSGVNAASGGGGGGGGETFYLYIASPSATYTYTIGAGGTAGSGGAGGGAGGSGRIEVYEFYG